jgi:hypothetical protein
MRQQPAWRPAITGVAAATAGLGTAELAAAAAKQPPLVDAVARLVVDTGPRPLVDLTVKLLGRADKPTIRAGVLTGVAALGALAGHAATRSARRGDLLAGTATLAGWRPRCAARPADPPRHCSPVRPEHWPRPAPCARAGPASSPPPRSAGWPP